MASSTPDAPGGPDAPQTTTTTTAATIPRTIPEGERVTFSTRSLTSAPFHHPSPLDHENGETEEGPKEQPPDGGGDGERPQRQQRRKNRRTRTKQWSDGVLFMANHHQHPHNKEEEMMMEELPVVNEKTIEEWRQYARPLKRTSQTDPVVNMAIPTTIDVNRHVQEEHGTDSWRYKTLEFIHNKKVQYTLMVLLLLDVLILFIEVTLMALFPSCSIIVRDAISCVPIINTNETDTTTTTTDGGRFLSGVDGSYGYDICLSTEDGTPLEPAYEYPAGCDSHKWHTVHVLEYVLFAITILILTVFFVELNVLMVVLTPKVFFRQIFYLVDYIIIGVSIALEIFFKVMNEELTSTLVGLMVIFRSWRYVRISHGIMEVTNEFANRKFERLLNYTERLEKLMQEQGMELPQDEKVTKLREENECELAKEIRQHHAEAKRLKKTIHDDENNDEKANHYHNHRHSHQQQLDGTVTARSDSSSETRQI